MININHSGLQGCIYMEALYSCVTNVTGCVYSTYCGNIWIVAIAIVCIVRQRKQVVRMMQDVLDIYKDNMSSLANYPTSGGAQ